ncbi:MAG: hypothetical protein AABX30_02140 [Nanoarchaeota archaeon]
MKEKKPDRRKDRNLDSNRLFKIFVIALLIILIFTFIDALIHSLGEEYAVPDYYFRNKIIFGALIGFFALLFIEKKKIWKKAVIFSIVVSILLQIRYFLEGYAIKFVLEFLLIHFVILFLVSLIVFKLMNKRI